MSVSNVEALKPWATERQNEYLNAYKRHGSYVAAANSLNVNESVLRRAISSVKRKAALQGHSPEHSMTRTVPDGFRVKGVSTYYDKEGNAAGQWVKSQVDRERQAELLREAFEAMAQDLPRRAISEAPIHCAESLATVYTLTDSHVGALCWHEETGEDWDLHIAEHTLTACFERLIASAPSSEVGIVAQLGDFLHQDGMNAVTPMSGHLLDSDGRFSKVVAVAIRILRRVVNLALTKHKQVIVLMAEGNHDMASSIWLRTMFKALYENEPRIKVVDSPLPYYAYQHGEVMLAWHHGHLKKNDQLPLLFASQFAPMWGSSRKRYCHTGHRHHVEEKEHSGMTVIQHPTLAARDAYAARGGWISERQACAITYHRTYGQVGRHFVTPEMVAE